MSRARRIKASGFMWAADYHLAIFNALRAGETVVRFALDSPSGEGPAIEYELRVTKIGDASVSRQLASMLRNRLKAR